MVDLLSVKGKFLWVVPPTLYLNIPQFFDSRPVNKNDIDHNERTMMDESCLIILIGE